MALPLSSIVDPEFAARAREAWAGDGIVSYWIDRRASAQERRTIREAFDRLDQELDVGFAQVRRRSEAELALRPQREVPDRGSGFDRTGETLTSYEISSTGAVKARAEIVWERGTKAVIRGRKRHTVLHEMGHGLGLDHPYGDPFNAAYDSSQTLMSYNLQGFSGWYAPLDLMALQSIWGAPPLWASA